MKYLLRMLTVWLRARRLPERSMADISRIRFTVRARDLDVLMHMNNGTYLTMQDLGRYDWMLRTALWQRLQSHGWSPVVARQTISYRRSLKLGEEYVLETRFIGIDDRNFFMEHRFVSGGQICAQSFILGRFTDRNGAVSMDRVVEAFPEIAEAPDVVPAWVREWADEARLPSTRQDLPSRWSNERP